jgi:hypothetical protein
MPTARCHDPGQRLAIGLFAFRFFIAHASKSPRSDDSMSGHRLAFINASLLGLLGSYVGLLFDESFLIGKAMFGIGYSVFDSPGCILLSCYATFFLSRRVRVI